MQKRHISWGKIVTMVFLGVFCLAALSATALAQKAALVQDAQKMMSDGWKQFNDGQSAVIEGWKMNNLVAVQKGVQNQMEPGNKVITTGRDTGFRGAQLMAQGMKFYAENKSDPKVAAKGIEMMREGFRIAKDGKEMIEKGTAMNNQVSQTGGFAKEFAQGDQAIKAGLDQMRAGAKLFLEGEAIYLKNK